VEKEMWGNALVWYQKAESLNPSQPELFQKIQDTRDRIGKRIRKSIAVFDFSSPSNDKDAGKMAADKLVAYLYQKASNDLRIIERENLQNILREMQLGQTGLVDVKSAQAIKMRGIDTFIMGNVLKVMATKTDTSSNNQVKVLVDEEDVSNPDFQTWLILHPRPTESDLRIAPPKTIKKRNYQFITYKQGEAKIVALFDVSYKLVDTTTGENIFTNTLEGRLVKEDKYQDGVPMANIPQDPLQLPTEAEVLAELTNAKISQMGQSVLKHFQSLEVEYFNAGEQLRKRRRPEEAVEKYVDALYDIKLKGISTAVANKSQEMIDELLQNR
jgi:curli biogenesis system outer membrane secretion channel CsgG